MKTNKKSKPKLTQKDKAFMVLTEQMRKREKLINKARKAVQKLENQQEKIYKALIADLGIEREGRAGDFLFDYVYNGTGALSNVQELIIQEKTKPVYDRPA